MSSFSTLQKASLVTAGALLLCLLPMPYGYFILVRLAVSVIGLCWVNKFYSVQKIPLAVITFGIVVLFQPFLRLSLDRSTWNIIDIVLATVVTFAILNKKL